MELMIRTEGGHGRPGAGTFTEIEDRARLGRAAGLLLGGFAGAAVCVVVPVLHLITTWALPLAGIVACVVTLRTKRTLTDISGSCPGCGEELALPGGRAEFPLREACPGCHRPLLVVPAEAP